MIAGGFISNISNCTPLILLLSIALTYATSMTVNETQNPQASLLGDVKKAQPGNTTTARRSRHIHEVIELPAPSKKTKRQIIKIPPSVSKVKLVQPPLNLRHNRAPQQFSRYPPNFRSGVPWRPANKKSQTERDFEMDLSFPYDLKKVKRNLKKPIVKEVSPEEFYRDGDYDYDNEERKHKLEKVKKHRQIHKVLKIKRKKPKQNVSTEYYDGDAPSSPDEGVLDNSKLRHEEAQSFYSFDPAGSSIQMQQVPPPNLFPQNTPKQSYVTDNTFYDEKYGTGLNIKKLPTKGRQVQSLFSQQYTTHNPHVTTNFGLGEVGQMQGTQYGVKGSLADTTPYDFMHSGKYSQQLAAASDQVVTAFPVKTPGIQVIQPPQFRDVTVSHPSHPSRLMSSLSQQKEEASSQKATIRDILEQDCPGFDTKGYCDSPPRYPMQQIKNMMKKCANLMEAMNTQPFEEQDAYSISKRSDNSEEKNNKSVSSDLEADSSASWSRSGNDGVTACISDLELTEPGYAKEVNSGRWFVIVQHPDSTIQRIATDMCRSPGKSCGGLSEMKCNKFNNMLSKSTRCVQRHTYQRLISWDPESPDECPRMRVFRFPSACVCHLGVI